MPMKQPRKVPYWNSPKTNQFIDSFLKDYSQGEFIDDWNTSNSSPFTPTTPTVSYGMPVSSTSPQIQPPSSMWNSGLNVLREGWDMAKPTLGKVASGIGSAFDTPGVPFQSSAFAPNTIRMDTAQGAWLDPSNAGLGRYSLPNQEGMVDISMPNAMATGETNPGFWNQYGGGITSGVNAAVGLLGAFNGYKQTQQAKKQFEFQKDAWNQQFNIQKKGINDQLRERQNYRNFVEPGKHQNTDAYIAKYGV